MSYITGILTALGLVKDIIEMVRGLSAFISKSRQDRWFRESAKTFKMLTEAKTEEQRKHAVSELARLWSNI